MTREYQDLVNKPPGVLGPTNTAYWPDENGITQNIYDLSSQPLSYDRNGRYVHAALRFGKHIGYTSEQCDCKCNGCKKCTKKLRAQKARKARSRKARKAVKAKSRRTRKKRLSRQISSIRMD